MIAIALIGVNRARDAVKLLIEAQKIDTETNDKLGLSITLLNLGKAYLALENYEEALSVLKTTLLNFQEIGDRQSEANTLCHLGIIHLCKGQFTEAETVFNSAIKLAREVGDQPTQSLAYWHLGSLLKQKGNRKKGSLYMKKYIDFLQSIEHAELAKYKNEIHTE